MDTKPKSQKSKNKIIVNPKKPYILSEELNIYNKVKIDIKDIADFCFCPMYYKFKKQNEETPNLRKVYDDALHKTFYSYLYSLQEDTLSETLEFLKYRWGKEWIKYKTAKDIVITPSAYNRDTYENLRKLGINTIFSFDEIMNKDAQCPIIINHKYEIEILPNIILTGTFEYVRELTIPKTDEKIIQIMQFIAQSNRFSTNLSRSYNIELIAASYAFQKMFNVKNFQVISLDVSKKRSNIKTYSNKEYETLKNTIKNVVICMQNDLSFVSPDNKCFNCEYRNICINCM